MKYFQEGGAMPQEAAPAQQPAGNEQEQMMQQLAQVAQQLIQELGPEAAAMVAQIIMEMLQGGGQQEMPAPEQQPAFQRNGGKFNRIR